MKLLRKTLMPIFALLALALAGCSDGSDPSSSSNDTITVTEEHISTSELANTTWSYSHTVNEDGVLKTYTNTLKFVSETNVTYSNNYKNESYSGTYSVSGSTVTLTLNNLEEKVTLIYVSDQLVWVGGEYTAVDSSSLGSAFSLAGTKWTSATDEDTTEYEIIEFLPGGRAISYFYIKGELKETITDTVTYSVSGSTVTIYAEGVYYSKAFYFDGKLVAGDIYTKDS